MALLLQARSRILSGVVGWNHSLRSASSREVGFAPRTHGICKHVIRGMVRIVPRVGPPYKQANTEAFADGLEGCGWPHRGQLSAPLGVESEGKRLVGVCGF